MRGSFEMKGSAVVIDFGAWRAARAGDGPAPRPDGAANDDGPGAPGRTVTVRRQLERSGVAVKIKVPVEEFIGVAVSTHISEEGVLTSTIELVHDDPELNYQVFEEVGNFNVVAEWQNWGRKLRLPLYIRTGDGGLLPYGQQVDGVLVGQTTARRKLAGETSRRPRFLSRRKPGGPSAP